MVLVVFVKLDLPLLSTENGDKNKNLIEKLLRYSLTYVESYNFLLVDWYRKKSVFLWGIGDITFYVYLPVSKSGMNT